MEPLVAAADVGLRNETFYEVVATIIPLVFLAVLIEYRGTILEWRAAQGTAESSAGEDSRTDALAKQHPRLAGLLALILALFLGLAEFSALDILWRQETNTLTRALIELGLAAGAIAVFAPLFLTTVDAIGYQRVKTRRLTWVLLALVIVATVLYFLPASGVR